MQNQEHPDRPTLPSVQRLRWQCRRGLLELDFILSHYLEAKYPAASLQEQQQFIELLQQQDMPLQAWLLDDQTPPINLQLIIQQLRTTI